MQIETVGKFQLHLIAHELPGQKKWDPFVSIFRFDETRQDFVCVVDKHHVPGDHLSYEDAISAAVKMGNTLIREHQGKSD
jgi:hypothetical protein